MSQSQHLSPTSAPTVFWSSLIIELQWLDSSQECISSHLIFPHLAQVSPIPRNHTQPLWGRGDFLFPSHVCGSLGACFFVLVVSCPLFCPLRRSHGWAVSGEVRGERGRARAPYARHPVHWILPGTTQIPCSLLRRLVFNASKTTAARQRHSGDEFPVLASVKASANDKPNF